MQNSSASATTQPVSARFYLAIALITLVAVGSLLYSRLTGAPSLSPVAGLMQLKALEQSAMPYETAIANGKPTFLEFYADWCSSCQAMAPSVGEMHEQYGERVNFVMLDIDNPAQAQRVAQYGVTGVPHFVVLDAAPKTASAQALENEVAIADSFVGRVPARVLERTLEQALVQAGPPIARASGPRASG